ncbi:hypothetical protein K2173_006456 [Erythroxylum novogranatense]|uniref:Uncharacterized protein n=1 Tax=Erythroxylum novogranatense TaxID=1862640 RepID=A0AAV8TEG3_9ROSI|nr:hypothetical protein K2173_006456 [Erythroxylum novogranatense]
MSKTVHLHKSLSDSEISKLKAEIFKSEAVKNLVSSNENYLLELALAEKLDDLNKVASVVSRLGKKCAEPALQGFEHVYADITKGVINVRELGFLVKDMDGMVRKMERFVNATSNLYSEMEVLTELEQSTKKFQYNQHEETRRAFEQKLIWQKQDVRHLKEISLWNQTYDKAVELLARTVCTIYARICMVFGESVLCKENFKGVGVFFSFPAFKNEHGEEVSRQLDDGHRPHLISRPLRRVVSRRSSTESRSGSTDRGLAMKKLTNVKPRIDLRRGEVEIFRDEDMILPCGTSPGRLFLDCLSLTSSASRFDDDDHSSAVENEDRSSQISGCCSDSNGGLRKEYLGHSSSSNWPLSSVPFSGDQRRTKCTSVPSSIQLGSKSRISVYAPPTTLGGSALALHYANVIIVIEKLLRYPHLVGEEARDDLYQMLPTSLRTSLKSNLKSYILRWLAPMAHNMIRWQSERNFEQHQIVSRTNVLLLQTLYFADREKTEAAICELLMGLNYICRYEHQQNALLDCASSFDFEDCMQWQLQCRASFLN